MLENGVFNRPYVRDITKICECACSMNCDKNATELRPDRNPDIITNADRIRSMSDEDLANEMRKRSISTICDIVCQGANCFCLDGCDYFEPTLTPPNEWVSVEERRPKYNIREDGELISSKILCYCETDKTVHLVVSQKFYTGRKGEIVHPVFRYYDEWGDEIEDVSHWMPLPESPKEDK